MAAVQVVVHAATLSPAARRGYFIPTDFWRSPPDVDVDGTRRLLEESARAGVAHFAYVSIVGVDRPLGRATQFFWLTDRMLGKAARLPVLPLPTALTTQPVDARDFATYVAE